MRKAVVPSRSARSSALAAAGVVLACVISALPAHAQTTNPNVVEFLPSAEHFTTLPTGQPAVTRYDLVFYQQGAIDGFMVTSLGKPAPEADGVIRVGLDTLLVAWPLPNVACEGRIAAVGPLGTGTSDPSNAFTYLCTYALSASGTSMPAAGGSASVQVTTGSHCAWTASTSAAWITITSGGGGLGSAGVGFTVATNTGAARSATIVIAGQSFVVSQGAATSNTQPTVQLLQPTAGALLLTGAATQVSVAAADPGGAVSRVDVLVNGSVIRSLTASPYSFLWTPAATGTTTIEAVAYDNGGLSTRSGATSVTVASTSYVSDLTWSSMTNGLGPVEKDRSNGGVAAGDGRTLTLNGKTYAKGLGADAASDVRYALGGRCSTFQSDIGVDDEVGKKGSIAFQVWADGAKLFDRGTMTGSTATRTVTVDVTSRQQLDLLITDAAGGTSNDHGDWAAARLTCVPAQAAPPPSASTYLSDAAWTSASNGWGPVEKDRSNGDLAAGDGTTLTLNGTTYAKGLGAHSASDIRYALNGACSTFQTDIGLDDEVGANGSVIFQVWADGVKLFDSGLMTGSSPTQSVTVNVGGRQELALIIGDGGDGNSYDHGDWAGARVTCTPIARTRYVSDLAWTSMTNGWGPAELDRSNGEALGGDGGPITLNGVTYAKGIGANAAADIRYALAGACSAFQASVGVDDEVGSAGSVVFQVWADGVQLFDSGVMTGSSATKTAAVDLAGRGELELVITDAGDGNAYDHGDWGGALISCASTIGTP
jgi:hypothetical protein